jgi:uncharacterized protein
MELTAFGHANVLSTHRNTIEFTKDEHLTRRGDCILAVRADMMPDPMEGRIRIIMTAGVHTDSFLATGNPHFSSEHEMVIRRSSFLDGRTFAIHADKAACDIDRKLVAAMKDPAAMMKVKIEKVD